MSEEESHPHALRPLQAGAATPSPTCPLLAAAAPPSPAAAGPELVFGSFTAELLASSWTKTGASSSKLQICGPALLPPPPPLGPGVVPRTLADLDKEKQILTSAVPIQVAAPRLRSVIVPPQSPLAFNGKIMEDRAQKWQVVRPKFWWRKVNPSPSGASSSARRQANSISSAAMEAVRFKGVCFRCLSPEHFVRHCHGSVHCLECRLPGHLARNCPSKKHFQKATAPRPPPPARAAPQPARRPRMDVPPGHPSSRPLEEHSYSIITPAMEAATYEMRRTHLAILISDPRLNISTRSIAKALQEALQFPWADIHVSAFYPDDFLVRFTHPWQRDLAYQRGTVPLRRGSMALRSWSPIERGNPQTWRFYCRVAIEDMPLCAWDDESTVKAVLGGKCELDRIERRSLLRDNTAALFAWVWSPDPDLIPRVKPHTILNRPEGDRAAVAEGTPAEEGRVGPLFRILIHLDKVKDYSPIDDSSARRRRDREWPRVYRHDWEFGVKDGTPPPRRRPARDRLGPSNHHNDDEDRDEHDERRDERRRDRGGRRDDHRRSGRWDDDSSGDGDAYHREPERRVPRNDRHDRRPSRSPERRRYAAAETGLSSDRRPRSPSNKPSHDRRIQEMVQPQLQAPMILPAVNQQPPRRHGRDGRSRSCTPTGSLAMGGTPSPPIGSPRHLCLGSPMQVSPPRLPQLADEGGVHYTLCSTEMDMPASVFDGKSPPASPLIAWDQLSPKRTDAIASADAWSANILPVDGLQLPQACYLSSPSPAQTLANMDAEQLAEEHVWAGLFGERSGSHDPNLAAIQAWNGAWLDGPTAGPYVELQPMTQPQLAQLASEERLFGPGYQQYEQGSGDQLPSEKTVLEVPVCSPASPGWQLHHVICPPQAVAAEDSSSDDVDDETLYHVTLQSNALDVLREANLCGQGALDEVTSMVSSLEVDHKTTMMSKVMGMVSQSLLGFPTNASQKKIKEGAKKLLSLATPARRSERPATKTSSMRASRRAQASACMALGLIKREDEFTEEILATYLKRFDFNVSNHEVQKLAVVTGATGRPEFVLPDGELQELLRDTRA